MCRANMKSVVEVWHSENKSDSLSSCGNENSTDFSRVVQNSDINGAGALQAVLVFGMNILGHPSSYNLCECSWLTNFSYSNAKI